LSSDEESSCIHYICHNESNQIERYKYLFSACFPGEFRVGDCTKSIIFMRVGVFVAAAAVVDYNKNIRMGKIIENY
jgi:hypothetical protein